MKTTFLRLATIYADPQLASFLHLSAGSPGRGAGSAEDATDTDIDGELCRDDRLAAEK